MLKRIILTVALAAFALIFSNNATHAAEPYRIAFSCMTLANPYFIAVAKGVEKRCEEIGAEAIIVDAKSDVAKQVNDIENMIIQDVDAIIVSPIDQNAIFELIEEAKEKGIVVISEAQILENAHGIFTLNEYDYGVVIGTNAVKWINEKLNGKAECLIISLDNIEPVIQRGNGIEYTIKQACPGATIVARQAGETPEEGMRIVENVLQSHPDVKIIVANNDSGALGAYEAVIAMQKNTDDMFIGGADAVGEAIAKMQEDNSCYRATVDLSPEATGADCVNKAIEYLKKGTPEKPQVFSLQMNPLWQKDVLN